MRQWAGPTQVNDIHSQLNATRVSDIVTPNDTENISQIITRLSREGHTTAVSGYRHAMGGQQFRTDSCLLDLRGMNKLLHLNEEKSTATFQAGANWQDVFSALEATFDSTGAGLSFRQKQTGADNLSLGGATAVNAHGRGLNLQAFVSEIESLTVVTPSGVVKTCSRSENKDLFECVVGGYGLFGVVAEVELRLHERFKVRRVVEIIEASNLIERVEERKSCGFVYGDFQFRIDPQHPLFLRQGVFSCYEPVPVNTQISSRQAELAPEDWFKLLKLAHFDKEKAFEMYSSYYMGTNDQIYWSDKHQMSTYLDGYHIRLDSEARIAVAGSEMITEIYVPRHQISAFLERAAAELRTLNANVIYGTVRLIEPDTECLLTWARQNWACTIFNLHIDHTPAGIEAAKSQFLALIDLAVTFEGSYFLTYHSWARKDQILACHPMIPEFLKRKVDHDPQGILRSDWLDTLTQSLGIKIYA